MRDQPEGVELADDPLEGLQRLRGLPDLDRNHRQRDVVVIEVGPDRVAVELVDGLVDDHQRAAVGAVAVCEFGVVEREYAVDVHQVVLDLLVALDVKCSVGWR